jgi:hypothetical protein
LVYGQNIKYIKGGDFTKFTKEQEYDEVVLGDSCSSKIEAQILVIEITTTDPEASDEQKQKKIQELSSTLLTLSHFKKCSQIESLILCVGDGLFLTKSDGISAYDSEKYYKKHLKTNFKRFAIHYSEILSKLSQDFELYYCDWYW